MIAIVIDLVLSHSSGRGARIAQEFQSGDLLQKSTWPAVVATSSVRRLKKTAEGHSFPKTAIPVWGTMSIFLPRRANRPRADWTVWICVVPMKSCQERVTKHSKPSVNKFCACCPLNFIFVHLASMGSVINLGTIVHSAASYCFLWHLPWETSSKVYIMWQTESSTGMDFIHSHSIHDTLGSATKRPPWNIAQPDACSGVRSLYMNPASHLNFHSFVSGPPTNQRWFIPVWQDLNFSKIWLVDHLPSFSAQNGCFDPKTGQTHGSPWLRHFISFYIILCTGDVSKVFKSASLFPCYVCLVCWCCASFSEKSPDSSQSPTQIDSRFHRVALSAPPHLQLHPLGYLLVPSYPKNDRNDKDNMK